MRSLVLALVLPTLTLPGFALADPPYLQGSVVRLTEESYRVQFAVVPSYEDPPHWRCAEDGSDPGFHPRVELIIVRGPFGVPTDETGYAEVREGFILWQNSTGGFAGEFHFMGTPSLLSPMVFQFSVGCYFYGWCCVPNSSICYNVVDGNCGFYGAWSCTLPTRVGDSAPLEPAVAIDGTTWGHVKLLYR
jgi:hypothetical protein